MHTLPQICVPDKRWPCQKAGHRGAGPSSELTNPPQGLADTQWGLCLLQCPPHTLHAPISCPWCKHLEGPRGAVLGVDAKNTLGIASGLLALLQLLQVKCVSLHTATPGIYFPTGESKGPNTKRQEQEEAAEQSRGTEKWQKTDFLLVLRSYEVRAMWRLCLQMGFSQIKGSNKQCLCLPGMEARAL